MSKTLIIGMALHLFAPTPAMAKPWCDVKCEQVCSLKNSRSKQCALCNFECKHKRLARPENLNQFCKWCQQWGSYDIRCMIDCPKDTWK
jgi:hypothetical protein